MSGHSNGLHCQIAKIKGARDDRSLRLYIRRNRQADQIWVFHIMSRRHVSRGPCIPIQLTYSIVIWDPKKNHIGQRQTVSKILDIVNELIRDIL